MRRCAPGWASPGWGKGKAGAGTHGRLRDRIRTSWEWSVAWEGSKRRGQGGYGGFLRLPATPYPFSPRYTRQPERARCDLTIFAPLSWHQPSPLKPEGLRRDAVHWSCTREKKMVCCSENDTASQDTALWRTYCRRTFAGYRRFRYIRINAESAT